MKINYVSFKSVLETFLNKISLYMTLFNKTREFCMHYSTAAFYLAFYT